MIYIIVALKAEAQAFIDKKIPVFISGIGTKNMFDTTKKIVAMMKKNDVLVNVGVCGASKKYKIAQLIDAFEEEVTCVDEAIYDKNKYNIVDMESRGFLEASQNIQNRYMYKVVSDHFEPKTLSKDGVKKLIFDKIDEIMEKINNDK